MRPSVTILARQQEAERLKKQQKAHDDATYAKAVAGDLEALVSLASNGHADAKALCRERFGEPIAPYAGQPLPYPENTADQRNRRLGVISRTRFPCGNSAGIAAALPEYEAERATWRAVAEAQAANPALPDFIGKVMAEDEEQYAAGIRQGQGYRPGDYGYGHAAAAKMAAYLEGNALAKASWELEAQRKIVRQAEAQKKYEAEAEKQKIAEEARIDAEARRRLAAERFEAAVLARMAELRGE